MRDTQRKKVYDWEAAAIFAHTKDRLLTLAECQRITDAIVAEWGLSPIVITDGRRMRRGCASRHRIKLPRFARHLGYLLHEVAHSIVDQDFWNRHIDYAGHGPEWLNTYLQLVEKRMRLPGLRRAAKAAGLKIEAARCYHGQTK